MNTILIIYVNLVFTLFKNKHSFFTHSQKKKKNTHFLLILFEYTLKRLIYKILTFYLKDNVLNIFQINYCKLYMMFFLNFKTEPCFPLVIGNKYLSKK